MDAILNINSSAAAFGDQNQNNNPKRRFFDWTRNINGLTVKNPKANSLTLYPGESKVVFDGKRVLGVDATTAWDLKSVGNGVYRFVWSAGTAPGMRVQRDLSFLLTAVTVSLNNNSTASFVGSGNCFANIQTGDQIYIPLPTDPDAKPFNPANGGFWIVLSASPNVLTLARPVGQSFNAASETTLPFTNTSAGPMLAYSPAGVQIGDTVDVSAGFQPPALKAYEVTGVTCNWFEVSSVSPVPEEVAVIPGIAGMTFYNQAKGFLRVECDQDALVYLNESPNGFRVIPIIAGDPTNPGWFENTGAIWTLTVVNKSQQPLNCNIFSAE